MRRIIFIMLIHSCTLTGSSQTPLLNFADPTGWKTDAGHVVPKVSEGRKVLTLNFRDSEQRLIARKIQTLDMSGYTSIRLRVELDQTHPLLESTLSFKSGNGWYRTTFTLSETGTHHLLRPLSEFTIEGRPTGWNSIEAVELAFWPRTEGTVRLNMLGLEAFKDTLWILDPEPLATNGDERYTARVTRRHHQRILEGLGIPYAMIPVAGPYPNHAPKFVILPSAPHLTPDVVQRLRTWSKAGTTLVVYGSEHPGVGNLLSVRLKDRASSTTVGKFDQMTPASSQLPGVYQHAWNFIRAEPVADSKVFARWESATGVLQTEPAAISGSQGVWVTTEWKSGDVPAKQEWMGEWISTFQDHLLRESLRYHQEVLGPRILNAPPARGIPSQRLMQKAEDLYTAALNEQNMAQAFTQLRQAKGLYHRAIAADTSPWNAELRGIWDQQGTGFYAGGWDETAKTLKAAGFNAVFTNMATAGRAHYPSSIIPPSKTVETYGDQLKAFTQAARRHGLQAHAWKICWKLNTRDPAFQQDLEKQGRLMQDTQGNTIPWLSLSDPRNIQMEIDSLLEMARAADLTGIHLDYMRYPGREADYGPAARRAFELQLGRQVDDWPGEVLGPLKETYQAFRQQEVHRAMAQISKAVKREFPDLVLSVAVWGAWPDCADAQGQDWPVWCRNGWVDLIIPMNYTDNRDQFAGWLDMQRQQPGVAERLVPGIGLISTNAELTTTQLLDQLNLVRERELPGAILYRLDTSLPDRVFPALRIWP